jgi:hypothetical protein
MAVDPKELAMKERQEPQIRLLVCKTCKTAEELPDWEGRPEDDVLLQISVERHQKPEPHLGQLYKFPVKYWARKEVKESIMNQIRQGGSSGLDVFGTNFYETKSQFAEDAMTCWGLHNRTLDCDDYKHDRKVLKPGTDQERKDAGLGAPTAAKVYLCDFCPVKSVKQKAAFKEKGLYN